MEAQFETYHDLLDKTFQQHQAHLRIPPLGLTVVQERRSDALEWAVLWMASLLNCLNSTVEWLTAPEALCLQSCSRQVSAAIQKIYQDMLDHTMREMEMQDRASQSDLSSSMERGATSPEAELRQHH